MKQGGTTRAGALLAILAGVSALGGWALDRDPLKSLFGGSVHTKPNTALGLMLGGGALLIATAKRPSWQRCSYILALATALLGVATLAEYVTGAGFGIDEMLFRDSPHAFNSVAGRMSPFTAWAFAMMGLGIGARSRRDDAAWLAVSASAAVQVLGIGLIAVVAYAWNVTEPVTEAWAPPVALHTALALFAIGCGMLEGPVRTYWSSRGSARSATEEGSFVAFWALVPVLVLAAGFSYHSNLDYVRAAWYVAHTQEVRLELARLDGCVIGAEAMQQHSLLAADARSRADFEARAATCTAIADQLAGLVADNPRQSQRIAALRGLVRVVMDRLRAEMLPAAQPLGALSSPAPRSSLAVTSAIATLDSVEQALLSARERREEGKRSTMLASLLAILLVLIGILGMLVRGMRLEIEKSRQLREEMRGQKAFLRDVINSIPDVIAYKDERGTYLGCNSAYAEIVGRPVEEIAGRSLGELFPPEIAQMVQGRDADAMVALEKGVHEHWIRYPDGTQVLFEMVRSPLRDSQGKAAGVLVIGRNVTERKKGEEEVSHARLLAEQATRAKSEFLANMSHEIRTPMTGVLGLADLLAAEQLTADQKRYVDGIRTSGRHLLSVINDILDFSRIESGNLEVEKIDFALPDVLQQLRSLASPLASDRGIALHIELCPEATGAVRGDPARLMQVLLNLVTNAIKFTERGSVVLEVGRCHDANGAKMARFEVRDTGMGIPAEVLEQLFTPFKQADSSTARRFGGSGLGLAICKRLVEAMGGTISAVSEVDVGSRFTFELPLEDSSAEGAMRADGVAASPVGKRRILIAEDVLINRDILGAVLRGQGHHVVFAHDGAQAVELVQSETFDLVLMDVQMPVMDGVEATRRIRNLPGPQRALPILGLTANVMARERDSYLRAGMDACLKKPIDWHELAEAMQRFTGDTPAAAQPGKPTQDGPSQPTHALVDLQVLADLEGAVGADAARTLLRDGMTTFHRYCEAMETGPGMELDVPHALASAHKIHGSAGTLGLRAIADAASRVEEALSRDPRDKAVIAQMRAAINGTVGELMQLGLLPASDNRAVP